MKNSLGPKQWYLGLIGLCLMILAALVVVQCNNPADGFVDNDSLVRGDVTAHIHLMPVETGLQKDDRVLAINGQTIEELREYAFTFTPPPTPLKVGQPAVYTVLRRGQTLDITVVPVQLSLLEILIKGVTDLFSGLVFWMVGLAVFLKKSRERVGQIFFLSSLSLGWGMLARGLFVFQPADLVNQSAFLIFTAIEFVTFWVNFPLIFHLLFIFPYKSPWLTKFPWLLPVAYCALMVLSLTMGFMQGTNLSTSLAKMDESRFSIAIVYLTVSVANLFYAFYYTKDRTARTQIKWIVWGTAISTFPWLFLYAMPLVLVGTPWVTSGVFNLALVMTPVTYGFSVIKYRLFDIESLIHRSLLYGLLTLLLGVIYILLVAGFTDLLSFLGMGTSTQALPITVAIIIAALFNPIREKIQLLIDYLLYKDRIAFRQLPLQVSRELSGAIQFSAITGLLTRTIPNRLQITAAELMLFDREQKTWTTYCGDNARLADVPINDDLLTFIQHQEGAVALHNVEHLNGSVIPLLEKSIEVIVPLSFEQRLMGLYTLYPKNSGDYYHTEEVEILSNLGYQTAISLSNALKFKQIEQLNLSLDARATEYRTLYQQERRRATQLGLINQVSQEVTAILEIDRLLNAVVRLIKESFDYHSVSVGLIHRDSPPETGRYLECVATTAGPEISGIMVGTRSRLDDKGITTRVARTGQPALVPDVTHDADYVSLHPGVQIASELTVPLMTQTEVIGILDLVSRRLNAFDNDDLTIMQTLARQIAVAIENATLYQKQAEQERIKQELRIARNIQTNLLSQELPNIPGVEVYGCSLPAHEVGGDFYNYFTRDDGQFGVAVGDVSGKGLPGSLFMAVSITALRSESAHYQNCADLLTNLNQMLYNQLRANQMNTGLLYLQLDLKKMQAQVGNAGLIAPFHYSNHQPEPVYNFVDVYGLPLGTTLTPIYRQQTVHVKPGDLIVICSDGILEAMNPQKQLFSFTRFEQSVLSAGKTAAGAQQVAQSILADVYTFMNGAPQHDDMTLVVLKLSEATAL